MGGGLDARAGGGFWHRLALLHLIRIDVAESDRDWFVRSQINQIRYFPYILLEFARTTVAVLVTAAFLPFWFVAIGTAVSLGLIARLASLKRAITRSLAPAVSCQASLERLLRVRAIFWAGVYASAMIIAPSQALIYLVAGAMLFMMVDTLSTLTLPRSSVFAAATYAAAIAGSMIAIGTGPALLTAVVAIGAFVFLHWLVFNLYYSFATRRLRSRKLEEANETIQLLLNQYDEDGSDWLIECDEEGAILRPNARFCAAAARPFEALDGLRLSLLLDDSPERDELRRIGEREETCRDLVVPLHVEGERRWWSITARPVRDGSGRLTSWRGFIADVTRTRAAEDKVTYMAHYDVLTGLANRSLFQTTLNRAFARLPERQLLAILYVDLDLFKAVNDRYGHATGDAVLAAAARRIESALDTAARVARLGGDEFAVVLDRIGSREEAVAQGGRIVAAMDQPIDVEGQAISIGASVGIAFAPDHGTDGAAVLRNADLALYDAKAAGRRGVSVFTAAMGQDASERRALELDLRSALTRGELAVHYQPLIDTETLEIRGYEALLRWTHPVRGDISPTVFIPIAEERGQIAQIGAWVLNEALREAALWPEDRFVSVNLSPAQLRDDAFLPVLMNALAASGVAPARLELEITETVLLHDSEAMIALLRKIRSLGVGIALDDFGTGYSSLVYLQRYPFTKIKIDRCFVSGMAEADDSDAILRAVVEMAGRLDMVTTAEGVENADQLDRLRRSGCHQLQGFLFGPAVPASAIAQQPDPGARRRA